MDTVGYGDLDPLPDGKASIENWATAAHQLLVALGVGRAVVVGHHSGAAIAVEIAAAYPKHVAALVLSASPYVDEARRKEARETGHGIDHAFAARGWRTSRRTWSKRRPFYPPDPSILWNVLSSMLLRRVRALSRVIASLIVMKWVAYAPR